MFFSVGEKLFNFLLNIVILINKVCFCFIFVNLDFILYFEFYVVEYKIFY